jgi:hypothetical protein
MNNSAETISTWRAIREHLQMRTGFAVSLDTLKRWSRRTDDPLPIRRWGVGRPRVVANSADLDGWVKRQWQGGAG